MVYPFLEAAAPPIHAPARLPTEASGTFFARSLGAAPPTASPPTVAAPPLREAQVLGPPQSKVATWLAPPQYSITPLSQSVIPSASSSPQLAQTAPPETAPPEMASPPSSDTVTAEDFLQLSADQQEYDTLKQVITAVGEVLFNYRGAKLEADRVQTRLAEQLVVAEGNVRLTRGAQVLEGDRLEYRIDEERGYFFKPKGIIDLPQASQDLSIDTPATRSTGSNPLVSLPNSFRPEQQPNRTTQILEAEEGLQRLRFTADRIEFTGKDWTAVNIRVTSDPFDPPELELRADRATLTKIAEEEDAVVLKRPRLVFDQRITVPIPRSTVALNSQRQDPFALEVGFDDRDRGGLFLGRRFTPLSSPTFRLSLTPQFFLERAFFEEGFDLLDPDVYGLDIEFGSQLAGRSALGGFVHFRSVDFANISDKFRAGLRYRRPLGDHLFSLEGAYRERVLSGSLGENTIQNRLSAILQSPTRPVGNTGLTYDYRFGADLLTAELAERQGTTDTLGRFQGSASLERAFPLWRGQPLPATANEGMKYTPEPIQPYLRFVTGLTGVASGYSNGDAQGSLVARVRIEGQYGHFSRPYFDYTGFYVGYAQGILLGESPFLFDRFIDRQVLSAGILQQVYGPLRIGFQTSLNLDTGELFNSDIILDYSRRTYGVSLRYNPNLQVGAIVFRINSFNWLSNRDPLDAPDIGVVEAGVEQINDAF